MIRRILISVMAIAVFQVAAQVSGEQNDGLTRAGEVNADETTEAKEEMVGNEELALTATLSKTYTYGNDYFDGRVVFNQAVEEFRYYFMLCDQCSITNANQESDTEWTFRIVPKDYLGIKTNMTVQVRAGNARTASNVYNEDSNTLTFYSGFYEGNVYISDESSYYLGIPTINEGATATSSTVVMRWDFYSWVKNLHGGQGQMNISKDDFVVTNGTATNLKFLGLDTGWELKIQPTANGEVTVTLPTGATDFDPFEGFNLEMSSSFISKAFPPSVSMTTDGEANVIGSQVTGPFKVTFTWDENIYNFAVGDIQVTNGTVSGFSRIINYHTYTANITPTALGDVLVTIPAGAVSGTSGDNEETTLTYNYYYPNATFTSAESSPTKAGKFTVNVDFSENVDGLELSDFSVNNATISNLLGSGAAYTVEVQPTATGIVNLTLPANTITSTANGAANLVEASFSINADPFPHVSITSDVKVSSTFSATIAFDKDISGFELSDILVTNGTAANLIDEGSNTFTVDITPSADATVSIDIPAGATQDIVGNLSTAATTQSVQAIITALTVSFTTPDLVNGSFIATATFNQAVTGFTLADIVAGNANLKNFSGVGGDGKVFTFRVTPISSGAVTLDLPANSAVNAVNAGNTVADQRTFTADFDDPVVTIDPVLTVTNGASDWTINISVSEAVTDMDIDKVTVANATKSNFTDLGSNNYSLDLTADGNGDIGISVANDALTDLAGNTNSVASASVELDQTAPTFTMTAVSGASYWGNTSYDLRIQFSEAVTGLAQDDFSVSNATIDGFTATDADTYTLSLTPDDNGLVEVNLAAGAAQDQVAYVNEAGYFSIMADFAAPSVTINGPAHKISFIQEFGITFSEPVTGFVLGKINCISCTASNLNGSGADYTVDVVPTAGTGSIRLQIFGNAAQDIVGRNSGGTPEITWQTDFVSPNTTISVVDPSVNGVFAATITFNEEVEGFAVEDLTVTNATIANFSGTGITYTADITPLASGNVTLDVAAGAAADVSGNDNNAATQVVVVADFDLPTVTISASDQVNGLFTANIDFNESVTGFEVTDITVSNGTTSNFSGSGANYTIDITPVADGAITIDIAADVAIDVASNGNTAAVQKTVTVDTELPTVTLSSDIQFTTTDLTVTINFSEEVTGFELADMVITNATASNFSGSGDNYTVDLSPASEGIMTINIAADIAQDAAGNGNTVSSEFRAYYDVTKPEVTLSAPTTATGVYTVSVDFNENIANFELSDFTVVNGTASDLFGVDQSYTIKITPINEGPVSVSMAANTFEDSAGNENEAVAAEVTTYDVTAPTVDITGPNPAPRDFTATITFSEPVSGFELSDLDIHNALASNLTGSGANYTVDLETLISGPLSIEMAADEVEDLAGNGNEIYLGFATTADVTVPTVSISADGLVDGSFAATITFSEAVSGFEMADVQLTNATASNFAGTDDSYSLDITPISEGNITIDIAADVALDVVGNGNTAATQQTVFADITAPTLSISADALANGLFTATITFSEAVTGFELADLVLSNATASNFAGSDADYTVDITPVAEGAFTIDVAADVALDQVNRGSEAATQFTGVADFTQPTVALTASTGSPNNVDNFVINLAFSETVTGLETSDFTVVNGTATAVSGSGNAYSVTVQPTADGDVTTTLNTGTYEDLAGNANSDQPSYAFTSDRTGPVGSFSYTEGSGFFTINVNFDQEVTDFTFGDLNISNATTSDFSGSGDSYSFKAMPVTYGTALTVGMNANRVHDDLGNPNLAATDLNISFSYFVPTLTIYNKALTESGSEIAAGSTTAISPLYIYLKTPGVPRQDELAVTASDFVTTNATITGVSYLGLDLGYQVAFTPDTEGTVAIDLPAGAISRPGGDANLAASTSFEFIDKPVVTISAAPSEAVNGLDVYGTFDVLFTWDEDVTDFELSDIVYGESTAGDFTQISASQYSLTLTPTGGHSSNLVQVSIPANRVTNPVGNSNDYTSVRFNYDASTKTTITPSVTGPINVDKVNYEITFSQAVSYFRQEDLVVTNGTVTSFSGIGKTFNASVDVLGHGELILTIPGGSATAGDFTGNTEATSSIFIDKIGPAVTLSTDFGDIYYFDPALISLTFDEEPTDFELSDITVTNGTLANLTGSGTDYTVELTADAVGEVTLTIAADAFSDAVGNGNAAQTLSLTKGGQTGPVFTSTPITSIENNSANTYLYNPLASDPNGDEVTYSVPTLPEWLTYETQNLVTTMATPDYSIGRARGVALDSEGSLYVANSNHNVILKYDDAGNQSIYAGQWGQTGLVDAATATSAKFRSPRYMVFDKDDNLFVVDQTARAIRKITPAGVVTTIAGANASGLIDGVGTVARFNDIRDIGVDNNTGTLYTTSWSNKVVRKITSDGTVSTFATGLFQSGGLAVDSNGNIFVTNYRELLKFTPDGTKTTFAGNYRNAGFTDGTGSAAKFYQLFGMGIDENDVLYLNDVAGIRQVTPEAVVTTIAGSRDLGTTDGIGTNARFWNSLDMASDGEGTIYVADQAKSTIRKIEATEILSGKPDGYVGDFDVVVEATDGINAATQQAFTISVSNAIPSITNFDVLSSCEDCNVWANTVTTRSVITSKVVYDEPVFVTGEPYIELNFGDNKLVYASGSGTNTLLFQGVVTGDNDNKGVSWAGNEALKLNGGSIKDANGADALIELGDDFEEFYIIDFKLSLKSMTTTAETGTYGIGDQFDIIFELEQAPTGIYYWDAYFKLKGDEDDDYELYIWQDAGDDFEETPAPKIYTYTFTVKEGHYSEEDFDIPYLDEPFYIEGYVESDDGSLYYEFYDYIKFTDETPDQLFSPGKQIRVDGIRPTIDITTDTDLARAFVATLTFNEEVTALDLADILVTNGTASNLTGSGKVYTVDITPTSAGEVTIGLGADAAEDLGGNGNIEATPVSVTGVAALGVLIEPTYDTGVDGLIGATLGGSATITFTDGVTGFELSDLVTSNLTITSFAANSAAEYVIEFSAVADGLATIDIPASVAVEGSGFSNEAAVQVNITADITAPVATLSFGESVTNETYPEIEVNFSEAVVGLEISDFNWTNGGDDQYLHGSGNSYTLELDKVNEGLVTVQLPAGAVTDAAGNATLVASDLSLTVDTAKPTLSIATSAASIVNAPFEVNFTFSEVVTDFGTEDINVSNAVVSDFAGSGNSYSVTLTPISDGLISTNVPAGVVQDLAGNTNLVGTALQVTANISFPEVIISSTASGTVTGTVEVAIEFNESVDGLTLDDFTVSNGTVANLSGSGTSYTIELTPDADGTTSVQLAADVAADAAGNGNQVSNLFSVLADFTVPSATLSTAASNPTNDNTIEVSISFSESVTGLETSDFTVTNGSVANLSGSGDSYTIELSPASDGDFGLILSAIAVNDIAGNANVESNTLSLTSDRTAPSVSISAASLVNAAFTASISFSEAVTGFDLADLTVTGATASNFSGSGNSYTVDLTPTMDGNVTLNIATSVAQDAAGNDNTAATTATVLADLTQTGVIISSTESLVSGVFSVDINFDESVTGFELSDISVVNATASNFTGSGAAYSVDLTPVTDGAVTVNIAAAVATDEAGNANTAASQLGVTADLSVPTVTLSSTASNPSNADSYAVSITFNESVTGLETSDFTVSNGTVADLAGSGDSYTLTLSPSADGSVSLTLAAASVVDDAGNGNEASNALSVTSDRTAPTVTASAASLVNGTFTVDFTFSEAVTGFDMTDLTVSNGTVTGLTGADAAYTATINPTADGNVTIDVAGGVAQDAAGNDNTAATTTTVSADLTQPGVSISTLASLVNGGFSVDITFDEAVTGFELSDLTIVNATAANFTGSGATYSVDLTPITDGAITVDVSAGVATDAAGNANSAASQLSVTADLTGPTVTLSSTASIPSNADSYEVSVTFSESVTGLEATDFTVSNGAVSDLTGSGESYSLTLSPSADGAVSLSLTATTVVDEAGNSNEVSNELSITSDRTVPTVSASAASLVNGAFTVDFTFSEAVTGFDMTDLIVANGTVTSLTGADAAYSATINPTADGNVTIDVAASVAQDVAGNDNTALSQITVLADLTNPSLTIATSAGASVNGTFTVDITFDEAVTGFDVSDISLTNATASNFTGSGTTYNVDLTPTTDGAITVSVPANAATDESENGNAAASQLSIDADLTAPTVRLSTVVGSPANAGSYEISVIFSEEVSGLETGDFSATNGSVANLSGSGSSYTLELSPATDGDVSLSLMASATEDVAGNASEASNELTITSDRTAPSVTLTTSAVSPMNGSFTATFTFSEEVSGFDLTDLSLTNAVATNLNGSGAVYSATITPSADGTVTLQVPVAAAQDAAGNNNTVSNELSIEADLTAPVVTLSTAESNPTNAPSFTLQISFSEPVTGFELSDIAVSNGSASGFSGSGTAYTATVSPAADGEVSVNVAAGVVVDAAGNDNEAAIALSLSYDSTRPSVTISSNASDLVYATSFDVTITFSESVTGFELSDLDLVNAIASDFAGSGSVYTLTISPVVDGEVSLSISAAKALDAVGNENTASNIVTKTVEATNEVPTDIALSNASIAENGVVGEEIGTLSASDPDLGDSHTFVLVSGDGDSGNAAFNIIGNTLIATQSFDYESQNSYSVRVRATDNQGLTLDEVMVITVTNTDEPAITISIPDPADNTQTVTDMSFSHTSVGQTSQRSFTISNSGTDGSLVVSSIILPTGFTADVSDLSLGAGESQTVTVTFAPTAEQAYSGTVDISSNVGTNSFAIAGYGEVNNAPIAVSPATSFHYTEGGTLQLNGYDPDGDAISYEIVTQPALGTLSATGNAGEYTFSPNSLSPETLYSDVIEFKVVETEGSLESESAEFNFTFEVTDAAHSITDFSAGEVSNGSRTITLSFDDVVINDSYQVNISYYDLSDPSNAELVTLRSETVSKSDLALTTTGAAYSFDISSADFGYLFSTEKVFVSAGLSTSNGFSDTEAFVLVNESAGELDNVFIGDEDGQFFVFAEKVTVPENNTATVKLNAIDLGGFDLSNASIEVTNNPQSGTLGIPALIKASDNLVQWSITYDADTEVGLNDVFDYKVYSPSRNKDVAASAEIEVIGINDAPVLAQIADQQTNEDQSITVPVSITDPDSEVSVTVTSSETTNVPVIVDGSNLVISPVTDFNGTANITVLVSEIGEENPLSTFRQFTLTIAPVNDKPVVNTINDLTIEEDGQVVVTLSATDADAILPIFNFEAVSDQPGAADVSVEAGLLTIKPIANFSGVLTFSVYADDRLGTNASVSDAETFSVTVESVNDAPEVTESFSVQSVVEGFPSYSLDLSAYFSDVETASEDLVYTVSSVTNVNLSIEGALMNINTISGAIGVQTATVTASDGELTASQTITFVTSEASGELSVVKTLENLQLTEDFDMVSIELSEVFAYSQDADAIFSYAISGNNNLEASMNGSALEITTPANYNGSDVIFIVASVNGESAFTSFGITVSGVNDAPELINEISDYTATEDAIFFKSVATSAFTDIDGDALSYEASFNADWLNFDGSTGVFSGIPTNNNVGTVSVTLTATDPSGEQVDSEFSITVLNTNDAPSALALSNAELTENEAAGYGIGTLATTDVDAGDSFVYALVSGDGDSDNASFSIIDNQLTTATVLDYEAQNNFSVRIQAADASGATVEKVFAITLANQNEAVSDILLSNAEVLENAASSTEVGSLNSIDPDTDDVFTYSLVTGEGADDNDYFVVSGATLSTNAVFDFEEKSTYQIRLRSTDAGGLFKEDTFTIVVDNVNEAPTAMVLSSGQINENLSITSPIGVFNTTDEDLGDVHTYSLIEGEGSDDNTKFSLLGNSLKVAALLNYEEQSAYQLRVRAVDNGGLAIEQTYTIELKDVNEAPTAIELSANSIDENEAAGTKIGELSTADEDANDAHSYALVTGDGGTDNGSFNIVDSELVASESFDYEAKNSYSVRVRTTDTEGLSFETIFSISINNVVEAVAQVRVEGELSFEATDLGDVATLDYTIHNDGDADLNVSGIVYPEGFSGSWAGGVISAGNSQSVTVSFQPTEEKTYSGNIQISTDLGITELAVTGEGAIITSIDDPVFGPIEVKVYPNPATDYLKIDLSELNGKPAVVSLWSINGNPQTSIDTNGFDNQVTIDVSNYREGVYLLRVESAGKTTTKKVMIKR